MKKSEIILNHEYAAKVSGKPAFVCILSAHPISGWIGRNETTGRQIRIKSAQRLRREITPTYLEQIQRFPLGEL